MQQNTTEVSQPSTSTAQSASSSAQPITSMKELEDRLHITAFEKELADFINVYSNTSEADIKALKREKDALFGSAKTIFGGEKSQDYKRFEVIVESHIQALRENIQSSSNQESVRKRKIMQNAFERQLRDLKEAAARRYNVDASLGLEFGLGLAKFKRFSKDLKSQLKIGATLGVVFLIGVMIALPFAWPVLGLSILTALVTTALFVATVQAIRAIVSLAEQIKNNPKTSGVMLGLTAALITIGLLTGAMLPILIASVIVGTVYGIVNKVMERKFTDLDLIKKNPMLAILIGSTVLIVFTYMLAAAPALLGTSALAAAASGLGAVLGTMFAWIGANLLLPALTGLFGWIGSAIPWAVAGAAIASPAAIFVVAVVSTFALGYAAYKLYEAYSNYQNNTNSAQTADKDYESVMKLANEAVRNNQDRIDLSALNAPKTQSKPKGGLDPNSNSGTYSSFRPLDPSVSTKASNIGAAVSANNITQPSTATGTQPAVRQMMRRDSDADTEQLTTFSGSECRQFPDDDEDLLSENGDSYSVHPPRASSPSDQKVSRISLHQKEIDHVIDELNVDVAVGNINLSLAAVDKLRDRDFATLHETLTQDANEYGRSGKLLLQELERRQPDLVTTRTSSSVPSFATKSTATSGRTTTLPDDSLPSLPSFGSSS